MAHLFDEFGSSKLGFPNKNLPKMERRRSCCSIKKQEYQTIEATTFIF
jgi:hypothetical protein